MHLQWNWKPYILLYISFVCYWELTKLGKHTLLKLIFNSRLFLFIQYQELGFDKTPDYSGVLLKRTAVIKLIMFKGREEEKA